MIDAPWIPLHSVAVYIQFPSVISGSMFCCPFYFPNIAIYPALQGSGESKEAAKESRTEAYSMWRVTYACFCRLSLLPDTNQLGPPTPPLPSRS